jgi:N6-L-threonylcarbamoyladenine synthase
MKILSIETSCDETAISILDAHGTLTAPKFKLLGNALFSQVAMHAQYGGVYPNVARREHGKNLVPLTTEALKQVKMLKHTSKKIPARTLSRLEKILVREPELKEHLIPFLENTDKPKVDAIAVTYGPGLEPALWVGITYAQALGYIWNLPVIPINHMEGHIVSVLMREKKKTALRFPTLALLISGGHTELVLSKKPLEYKIIGRTRDDAVGEAYDKVARMLSLSYPGGPEIARLAEKYRKEKKKKASWSFPRPMIHTPDFEFSFSGLKTSVLYRVKDRKLTPAQKAEIAKEFEDAIRDVLITKTRKAILSYKPKSLVVAGGVIANAHIRSGATLFDIQSVKKRYI